MKKLRKSISCLLVFAMVFSLFCGVTPMASAADKTQKGQYVSFSCDSGNYEIQVNVVHNSNPDVHETFTVQNTYGAIHRIQISVNAEYQNQYEIEKVEADGGSLTSPSNENGTFSANWAPNITKQQSFTITLCDPVGVPTVEGEFQSSLNVEYHVQESQLFKMLYLAGEEVSKDTPIDSVSLVLVEPHFWETEKDLTPYTITSENHVRQFWDSFTYGDTILPDNIRYLEITYGDGKIVQIPADDLLYKNEVVRGVNYCTIYANAPNPNNECVVLFYDQPGIESTQLYQFYDVKFVKAGGALGLANMPDEPEYSADVRFANWTTDIDGGDAFYAYTVVSDDTVVYSKKEASYINTTQLRVMNTDGILLDRIVELYNIGVSDEGAITSDQIRLDTVKIRVLGQGSDSTNPNYNVAPSGWYDDYGYYTVNNQGIAGQNPHIPVKDITAMEIFFRIDGSEETHTVMIQRGDDAGDFVTARQGPNITNLVINGKPSAPTDEDLTGDPDDTGLLGEGAVTVDCTSVTADHADKTYGLKDGYTIGEVEWRGTGDAAAYYVDITVTDDPYVVAYNNADGVDVTHRITGEDTKTITLKWAGSNWTVASVVPVTFTVTCEEDDPTKPDFDADDLPDIPVQVICVQKPTDHKYETSLDQYSNAYTEAKVERCASDETVSGSPLPEGYDWKCTVTINTALFVGLFNSEAMESGNSWGQHEFVSAIPSELVLYYGSDGWELLGSTSSVIIQVEEKSTGTYTLTYDFNGGIYPQQDGTLLKKNSVTLAPGTYNLDKVAGYLEPVPKFDGQGEKVLFAGWTKEPPEERGKVYHYDDPDIPEIEESVTITNQPVTVYAVWGYDEDQDGVADINEVIITPADITIYTGGTGYLGVTTNEDGDIVQTTESGLPQPGYHIGLPANIQTWLGGDGDAAAENLEDNLTFTYNGTDGEDGTTSREWGMSYAGIYALDEKDNPSRYVYTLNPSKDGNNEIPVRILYTDENGKPQEDDKIEMSQGAAHETYFMTINPGKLDQKLIQATLTKGNESKTLNVFIGTGTLTIRSVVEEDPTTAIANDAGKVNSNGITAVAGNNVDYYVNDSQVEITNPGDVKLLVDQVSNDNGFNGQMAEDAIAHVVDKVEEISDATNLEHKMVYLDLVDTTNGNTVVKLGDGQAVDIYWPLPSGATAQVDDTVHVVHYTDMNRESVETDLGDTVKEIIDGTVVEQNGQLYVKFSTGSFSPFVLVYEAKDTGGTDPGTEPDPDPNPGGDHDYDPDEARLHFNSRGGTEFEDEVRKQPFDYNPYNNIPSRPGYRFTGWYDSSRLDKRYPEDEKIHVPLGSKTVFAGWEETTVPSMLNGDDHYAYIQGYADGTVRPNANITRAQVATIFFRLLDEDVRDDYLTTYNTFPDVNEDYWANTAISTMASLGVINGRNSGLFDPDAYITRAEFAAICARFDDSGVDGITTFTDTVGHWAEDEISRAAALGWIQGYADGTFRPNQYITRAQAVTMINRVLCRLPETEDDLLTGMNTWTDCHVTDWFYLAIQEATNSHDFVAKDRVYESWTDLNRDPDWSRYE